MKGTLLAAVGLAALLAPVTIAGAQDPGAPAPPPMRGTMMHGGMDGMLERRFAEMDANHDGVVTRAEYDAGRAKMRAEREARMKDHRDREFGRLDADHNGAISRQEFDAPPPPPPPPPAGGAAPVGGASPPLGYDPTGGVPPPPPPGGDMGPPPGGSGGPGGPGGPGGGMKPDWFDRADTNHDGKVTLAEAKAAFHTMMPGRNGMHGRGRPGGDMAPPPPPQ